MCPGKLTGPIFIKLLRNERGWGLCKNVWAPRAFCLVSMALTSISCSEGEEGRMQYLTLVLQFQWGCFLSVHDWR